MPRGVESPHGQLGVRVVRRGDDDQLDRRIGQGLVEAGITADALAPERDGFVTDLRVARDDPVQREPRLAPDQRTVERPACQAVADDDGPDHRLAPAALARAALVGTSMTPDGDSGVRVAPSCSRISNQTGDRSPGSPL